MAKRALIAGCGYVGGELAQRLQHTGWDVWALTRRGRAPKGATALSCDLLQPDTTRECLQPLSQRGFDVVCYLVSAGQRSDRAYREAYVDGLENLLAAMRGGATRRLILVSSTGVYHQDDGEWVDETSDTAPPSFSGQRLLESEQRARASGIETSVVRLSGIYGPGRTYLPDTVRSGQAIASLERPHYRNRIHRDDAAGLVAHLCDQEQIEDCYIGVDDDPADLREVQAWLARETGRDPEALAPPQRAISGKGKRCRNTRLRASGYALRYPSYRDGYRDLLRAADEHEA